MSKKYVIVKFATIFNDGFERASTALAKKDIRRVIFTNHLHMGGRIYFAAKKTIQLKLLCRLMSDTTSIVAEYNTESELIEALDSLTYESSL